MENLETPYEEDEDFIECTVCEKSLRGQTLYKIHQTTPGHLKKEEILIAKGQLVKNHKVPKFKDIEEYLEYLNLDEPIIGLSFLDEVAVSDPLFGPKYICKLCNQLSVLAEMVCHVIGRRHRQKYVEVKRPDLVTWDNNSLRTQGGKIMRTKAEIIERQDGRGAPTVLKKWDEDRLDIASGPPDERHRLQRDISSPMNRPNDYYGTPNYPDEPFFKRSRLFEDEHVHSHIEHREGDFPNRPNYRETCNPDHRDTYRSEYPRDPEMRGMPHPRHGLRYGSRERMPHDPANDATYQQEGSYKRPFPDRGPEFYSEEVCRDQARPFGHQPFSPMGFPEGDARRWESAPSMDTAVNMGRRQGTNEPDAKKQEFYTPFENKKSHDPLFKVFKDYNHQRSDGYPEEALNNRGQSGGMPSVQNRGEASGTISNLPEPFRRFLKGGKNEEEQRKRKSRFSDASPEEMKMANNMLKEPFDPTFTQTSTFTQPVDAPMGHKFNQRESSDQFGELTNLHQNESFSKGGPHTQAIFDMLKTVEIENEEEAEFLKSKLANLLEEFKSKKKEKRMYDGQNRPGVPRRYGEKELDPQFPQARQFDRASSEQADPRRPEGFAFNTAQRPKGWQQSDYAPKAQEQSYTYPVQEEPRAPWQQSFEQEPPYPKGFEEPVPPRDYKPAVAGGFDSRSPAPPQRVDQINRMPSKPCYSSNLDKITSALLELVARK